MNPKIQLFTNYIKNLPGFRTNRKIVVIESDDWGSIRMPSREAYAELEGCGFEMSGGVTSRYNKYDTLATGKDLNDLFEVLTSVKDGNGNYCVMTPMAIVANPDFKKIRENNYSTYFYEPFTATLNRYASCENSFQLWKEGIRQNIFIPQFHGREHLNITRWMQLLQQGDKDTHIAFNLNLWGYPPRMHAYDPRQSLQAAFNFYEKEELKILETVITEGLSLFNSLFGYKASYFVPTNGPVSSKLENGLSENGIRYIQTARMVYKEPVGKGKTVTRYRYLGMKNKLKQIYLTRNCFFEPSENQKIDWVSKCLSQIETAFSYHKPAIISTHRVNFVGALFPENRETGLSLLKDMLKIIVTKWPDVEFMPASNLGDLISKRTKE